MCALMNRRGGYMDYKEWESLKTRDRVKRLFEGAGTIIASCGIGRVVRFDSGK